MNSEVKKINEALLHLIDEHELSANDIADVIAEQVTAAKNSSNEKVSFVANRLERKFGSKKQTRGNTANYNAKADDFGGYFLSFLLSISSRDNMDGIAIGLEALESSYEIKNSIKSAVDTNRQFKKHVEWYEQLGLVLSNEIQDEMYGLAWSMKDANDLMFRNQEEENILNAISTARLAIDKGKYIEAQFWKNNISDIKSEHIVSAFFLMIVGQANSKDPTEFTEPEIINVHAATLALGVVGATEEDASNITSIESDNIKLIIKWILLHYAK